MDRALFRTLESDSCITTVAGKRLIAIPKRIDIVCQQLFAMTLVIGGHWFCGQAAGTLVDVDEELLALKYEFCKTVAVKQCIDWFPVNQDMEGVRACPELPKYI